MARACSPKKIGACARWFSVCQPAAGRNCEGLPQEYSTGKRNKRKIKQKSSTGEAKKDKIAGRRKPRTKASRKEYTGEEKTTKEKKPESKPNRLSLSFLLLLGPANPIFFN